MSPSLLSLLLGRLADGPAAAAELASTLGVSQATISRALRALAKEQRVLRVGSTRGARYALRRHVGSAGSEWPVYAIDSNGAPRELATLHAIERDSYLIGSGPARMKTTTAGLPYWLQDARPSGFLGRAVPALNADLDLPPRVVDWSDAHVLTWLTLRGSDLVGDIVLGSAAMDRQLAAPTLAFDAAERGSRYPRYAQAAMAGMPPGSSAQGEHPKFTTCIAHPVGPAHVIVKFSPPVDAGIGQRWADLLTAEHLAHRVLEDHGIAACRSEIFACEDRVFLECERFDRVGARGRRGVASLFAIDAARYGLLDSWTACAERLAAEALLSADDMRRVRLLDAFGALIANTDRHFGNLTLFDDREGRFALAPVYDMLPMLFAPQADQLVAREFEVPTPRAAWLSVWDEARSLATRFWARVASDRRISDGFRRIAARCGDAVAAEPAGRS